jgi:hypothetical protein
LELAQWLASDQNPLTPRVIVNRVWQHMFGQGLVTTTDNFGANGDTPSHPELLDYLASEFVRDGWSVKRLVRRLALTRAYRLGAEATPLHRELDAPNRLVWRHSPRRLDAEEMRDALLASSGRLELNGAGGSAAQHMKMIEIRDDGPEALKIHQHADRTTVRSVYLPLLRGLTPRSLEPFDPVTQTLVTGARDTTTVPSQALFLLNSTFVRKQALALAGRLLEAKLSDTERIRLAYRLTLSREPSAAEIKRAQRFVPEFSSAYVRYQPVVAQTTVAAKEKTASNVEDLPVDQDDERGSAVVPEERVEAPDARTAAWMSFAQALYASAEFRFIR